MNIAETDKAVCGFCSEMRKTANDTSLNEKERKKQIKKQRKAFGLKIKHTICYKILPFCDELTVKQVEKKKNGVHIVFEEHGAHGTCVEIKIKKYDGQLKEGDRVSASGKLLLQLSPYAFSEIYLSHALYTAELIKANFTSVKGC